jgi:hypothetical protein
MTRTVLLSLSAFSLSLATSALAQTAKPNPFLAVLYQLNQNVEAIADDAARVCRLDLTSLPQAGRNLSKLKKIESDLSELRKRYGARSDFPAAEARRIGGRIESIEASLVRLKGAPNLVQDRDDGPDATGQMFFEAAQTLCGGDAEGVFEDVCKAQGGTPSETCESCYFGLLTCCEKFCTGS